MSEDRVETAVDEVDSPTEEAREEACEVLAEEAGEAVDSEGADEADDYALFESPVPATSVVLHAGEIAVLPPEDAHKPGCIAEEAPVHVKKVVVKVRA